MRSSLRAAMLLLSLTVHPALAQDWSFIAAQNVDFASSTASTAITNAVIGYQTNTRMTGRSDGCWKERWCVPGATSRSRGTVGSSGVVGAVGNGGRAAGFAQGGAVPAQAVPLTYQPTAALQREQQQAMIGRLQSKNPEAARALSEQFSRHNFQQVYRGLTTPFGLHDDDTADILTAYTALGYLIATGSPDPSPQAVRSLREQIAPKLAANPQLSNPSTRAKLGEELKILFVTLHAGWQSARREGNIGEYAAGVARLFQQQGGTDLRQVRLTDSGFVKR